MTNPQVYTVELENFQGPLDLLLHLIERQELEITDISLSQVTGDYLVYVTALDTVSHRELSWFVDVAARLLIHKSRALGKMEVIDGDEDDIDEIDELTKRLQVLQVYRRLRDDFSRDWQNVLGRGGRSVWLQQLPAPNLNQEACLVAQRAVSQRRVKPATLERRPITISRHDIAHTMRRLVQDITVPTAASGLIRQADRRGTVLHLLALLELIKQESLCLEWQEGSPYVSAA